MTKKAIFIRKLRRDYKKKDNWDYSEFKGYPKGTYFGYASWNELKKSMLKEFTAFYGHGLKKLRFETM